MRRRARGFTLADVMVGVAVGTLVIGAAVQLFLTVVAGGARVHAHLDLASELRLVEVRLRRDIGTAAVSGQVSVEKDGSLKLEQIRAGKPGGGFDSEQVLYAKKDAPGGARLARNGKLVSRALVRALEFERMAGDELMRVSVTLADPDRPIEVKAGFVISTVATLRPNRDTDPAPPPAAL